jgi:CBS domain-containing protein
MNEPSDSKRQKLPVHSRETLGTVPRTVALSVFCPTQATSIPVDACVKCESCVEVRATAGGFVDCRAAVENAQATNRGINGDGREVHWVPYRAHRMDLGERAARLPLGELVNRNVLCVLKDTPLASLAALFLRGEIDCAPVVDADGGLVGIVSKSDLLHRGIDKLGTGTVGDVMTTRVHALPDHSTVAYAFALIALERLQHIPVVSRDGVVVGLLSAIDGLRWVTDQWGFVSFIEK